MLRATCYLLLYCMSKKNIILGTILIILVAFAWVWSGPIKNWQAGANKERNFLADIILDKVSKIEITKAGNTVALEKTGDKWKVGGTKDFFVGASVSAILNSALSEAGLKEISLAGSSEKKKNAFGTDESGTEIKINQEGKVIDFILGKNTPDFSGSYISPVGSSKTYEIKTDLNSVFVRDEWRDLAILSFSKDQANSIRFQYPGRQFTVEKKDNKWAGVLPKPFSVTESKITEVLGVLANLQAVKIPTQDFKGTGLEKNNIIIQVKGKGFDNTLMIGDCTKDNLCYAKRGDSDNIYLISKTNRDALDKKITDLK
jgi:hypothetical protein